MQTNTNAFVRTSPMNQNVHKRMLTNDNELTEVLFVSMHMLTLGRFRLCLRRPLLMKNSDKVVARRFRVCKEGRLHRPERRYPRF